MAVQRSLRDTRIVRDLRKFERAELCRILNKENAWKELGYGMEFAPVEIDHLKESRNPTDKLLTMWGENNHTIVELLALLQSMDHHQARVHLQSSNKQNISVRTVNQAVLRRSPVIPEVAAYVEIEESHKIPSQPSQIHLRNEIALENTRSQLSAETEPKLPEIPYEELAIVTGQWSERNILGEGGFSIVYSGTWKDIGVAIKRASYAHGVDPQRALAYQVKYTKKEIDLLTSCRHENILSLYGFSCDVNKPPCLVYELMPNGSLGDRLRLKDGSRPLNWIERLKIANGTARGLNYLHRYANRPLIHGDIKSDNILLDRFCEPKIGDFGLAREGPAIGSYRKLISNFGTRSYQPDEFRRKKRFSTKFDIYSFGIILLELGTGLESYKPCKGYRFLKNFVDSWNNINVYAQRDMKAGDDNHDVYTKLMVIGKRCSNRIARRRPEMDCVFCMLNNKSKKIRS